MDNNLGAAGHSGQPTLRSPLKSSEWGGDDPIRSCPDAHMDRSHQYLHPTIFPLSALCLMTMSTCPLSTILGPGVQLGVPRICLRHIFAPEKPVSTFSLHSIVQQLPPLHISAGQRENKKKAGVECNSPSSCCHQHHQCTIRSLLIN